MSFAAPCSQSPGGHVLEPEFSVSYSVISACRARAAPSITGLRPPVPRPRRLRDHYRFGAQKFRISSPDFSTISLPKVGTTTPWYLYCQYSRSRSSDAKDPSVGSSQKGEDSACNGRVQSCGPATKQRQSASVCRSDSPGFSRWGRQRTRTLFALQRHVVPSGPFKRILTPTFIACSSDAVGPFPQNNGQLAQAVLGWPAISLATRRPASVTPDRGEVTRCSSCNTVYIAKSRHSSAS